MAMTLGDRMKTYEANTETTVCQGKPTLIRLDGHGFSKLTRPFKKPFDDSFHKAMVFTCHDLLTHFPEAVTAYTQSDEITLVFPAGIAIFSGRVQKIVSLAAAWTTVRFNYHLEEACGAALPQNKMHCAF